MAAAVFACRQHIAENSDYHMDLVHVGDPLYATRPLVALTMPAVQWCADSQPWVTCNVPTYDMLPLQLMLQG